MSKLLSLKKRNNYWNNRFKKGPIYGTRPSRAIEEIINEIQSSKKILVIGGGYGRNAFPLATDDRFVVVSDISLKAVNLGTSLYPKLVFMVSDVVDLPLREESFDVVIALYILNLFLPREINTIFKKITTILNPKGLFCANFLSIDDAEFGIGREIQTNTFLHPDGQLVHFFTEEEVRKMFKYHNFKLKKLMKIDEKRCIKGRELRSRSLLTISTKY